MIDWKKDVKDAMWAMFWLKDHDKPMDLEADQETIKENIARLVRMTTQKTAGQRRMNDHVDWNALEHTMLTIVGCATSLAWSGAFGPMPDKIEE